jgi:MFS family permease
MHTVPATVVYKEAAAQWVAIGAAFCGLLFGYDIGAISVALPSLKVAFALSPFAQNLVAAAAVAGAIPGAALGGRIADRFGRRYAGMAASLLFFLATLVTASASTASWLAAGRALSGFGIGTCVFLGPLYISEAAPAESRGAFVSVNQLLISVGLLACRRVRAGLCSTGASTMRGTCSPGFAPPKKKWRTR